MVTSFIEFIEEEVRYYDRLDDIIILKGTDTNYLILSFFKRDEVNGNIISEHEMVLIELSDIGSVKEELEEILNKEFCNTGKIEEIEIDDKIQEIISTIFYAKEQGFITKKQIESMDALIICTTI